MGTLIENRYLNVILEDEISNIVHYIRTENNNHCEVVTACGIRSRYANAFKTSDEATCKKCKRGY